MSDLGNRSDAVGLGGTFPQANDAPNAETPPPACTEEEAPSAAEQPSYGEGMGMDFNQPDTSAETLTGVSEALGVRGIPDKGDHVVSLHLFVHFSHSVRFKG